MPPSPSLPSPSIPAALRPGTADALDPPHWWAGDPAKFGALAETRREIHQRDRAVARKAQSIIMATLVSAISAYSVDATGAMSIPVGSGSLLLLSMLLAAAIIAWLLDRRLMQQLSDLDLRCRLWHDLVESVRNGSIDAALLAEVRHMESEVEALLRREAAVAAEFLASQARRAPHLPLLGHCFTLENS